MALRQSWPAWASHLVIVKVPNRKITEDGKVQVLDFGLAKALVQEPSEDDSSQSPIAAYHA